jgi:DEAD/DEAH box helicase domain-containing protein
MGKPVVLDLETQRTFRETPDPKKLGISVVGIYDYATESFLSYAEDELVKLFPILEHASVVVGFNIESFDMQVLQAYYPGKVTDLRVFDILEDIKLKLGRRLALNDIVGATLGKKKSGHGLGAIELFKNGEIEKLKSYCLDDVRLTKELFDFGLEKNEIFYPSHMGVARIEVIYKESTGVAIANEIINTN